MKIIIAIYTFFACLLSVFHVGYESASWILYTNTFIAIALGILYVVFQRKIMLVSLMIFSVLRLILIPFLIFAFMLPGFLYYDVEKSAPVINYIFAVLALSVTPAISMYFLIYGIIKLKRS